MEDSPRVARAVLDSLKIVNRTPSFARLNTSKNKQGVKKSSNRKSLALYALLRTQADYKSGEKLTSDTLIRIATDYYGTRRKSQHAALAQHYLGCTYLDMGRDLDAIEAHLRATTLFPDTTNKYFANSLFDLGVLYSLHHLEDSAWVAFRRYRQTEVCQSDSENISYADYYMGSVALYVGRDDVADSLFRCVEHNTKSPKSIRYNTYFQLAKFYYYRKHNPEKSLDCLKMAGHYFGEENSALLTLRADILAQEQQPAKAYDFYKKAIQGSSDIYVQCTAYEGLASVAPLLNKPDSTRFFIAQYKSLLDSIYTMNKQKEIAEIKDMHIVELHDQQMKARNTRLYLGIIIFVVALLSAFVIILLLIDRKRKGERLKYEEALASIREKQMEQLAHDEETSPDVEGYDEVSDEESDAEDSTSVTPFVVLQRERLALYRAQYAVSPWPQYLKAHEADIALDKKMDLARSRELMRYLDTLFSDMFVIMYGSNLNLNKYDFEYCAMVMLGFTTSQMSYCTQATVHSYHCRHGKMKTMLSDEWYQIVYGREKPKKKSE